jgi:predicted RecB family nuclease
MIYRRRWVYRLNVMEPISPITLDVLEGYLQCRYLGTLRLAGDRGEPSEYLAAVEERRQLVRTILDNKGCRAGARVKGGIALTREALLRGEEMILDARLVRDGMVMDYPGLQRMRGDSALGHFHYAPMFFCAGRRPDRIERVLVEVLALLLENVQGVVPRSGLMCCGPGGKSVRVKFSVGLKAAKELLEAVRQVQRHEVQPRLILNEHCSTCEFSGRCQEQAVRDDSISLLRGLGEKAIAAYARKGILTLTQLAHTFRPRRSGKRSGGTSPKRYHALRALAIRDRQVYVLGTPSLPNSDVTIYLDLEGVPDDGFVYLIGMLVCDGTSQTSHSFWANGKGEEGAMFERFLDVVASYGEPTIIAYGGYERAFIKRMRDRTLRKKLVDGVLARLVNLLGIVYAHFYFPTHSNGLKEIGRVLGARWTEAGASGARSLLWRHCWETSGDHAWKEKLVIYNQEDCAALRTVTEYLRRSGVPESSEPPMLHVQELDRLAYAPKWARHNLQTTTSKRSTPAHSSTTSSNGCSCARTVVSRGASGNPAYTATGCSR